MATRKDVGPDGLTNRRDAGPDGVINPKAVEEDDVEGHSMLISPTVGRDLERARSADVDRSMREKQHAAEAKRIFRK